MCYLEEGKKIRRLKERESKKLEDLIEKIIEVEMEAKCPNLLCERCLYGYYDSEEKRTRCMMVSFKERLARTLEEGKKTRRLKERQSKKLEDLIEKIIEVEMEAGCPNLVCEKCLYGYYDSEEKVEKK